MSISPWKGRGHPNRAFRISGKCFGRIFSAKIWKGCVGVWLVLVSILPEKAHLQEEEKCVWIVTAEK